MNRWESLRAALRRLHEAVVQLEKTNREVQETLNRINNGE